MPSNDDFLDDLFHGRDALSETRAQNHEPDATPAISGFFGPYRFLSNFWFASVSFDGVIYPTNEHAFQAAKTMDPDMRERIREARKPQEAKRLGRQVVMREDWERIKVDVMRALVWDKFTRNPALQTKLLETGDAELVEENTWGDRFWGRDPQGRGENWLGRILMDVRADLAPAPAPASNASPGFR